KKGYDLLVVGVENTRVKNGGFHQDVSRIASALEGPLAIVAGSGDHLKHPQQSPLHILVPVTGNEVSRRATDVAIALARASDHPPPPPPPAEPGRSRLPPPTKAAAEGGGLRPPASGRGGPGGRWEKGPPATT